MLLADSVELLRDIDANAPAAFPRDLTEVAGLVYYSADSGDAAGGRELYVTDGTQAGTRLVKDIRPGSGDSWPVGLTNVNGTLYFLANDGVHGYEPWKTDGTAAGTVMIADATPGPQGTATADSTSSFPTVATAALGDLFFFVPEGARTLWRTDGTPAGTVPVKSLGGEFSTQQTIRSVGAALYFSSVDAATGHELWKTDGSPGGTTIMTDLRPGPASSFPSRLTAAGGLLYFVASVPAPGGAALSLVRTDGTPEGTVPLADGLYPFAEIVASGDTVYFMRGSQNVNSELWKTNGTPAGTVLVRNFDSDPNPSFRDSTRVLAPYSGGVLLSAYDAATGTEFWKSDGTPQGTLLVKDLTPGPTSTHIWRAGEAGGTIYLSADHSQAGRELWKSDATPDGTFLLADLLPGPVGSWPQQFQSTRSGNIVFVANLTAATTFSRPQEDLFTTDGTPQGTRRGPTSNPTTAGSFPGGFVRSGGLFYFATTQGLWVTDGTAAGTRPFTPRPDSPVRILGDLNGVFLFTSQGPNATQDVWRTDGTAAGTARIANVPSHGLLNARGLAIGDVMYLGVGATLLKTDGTVAGTTELRTFVRPGFYDPEVPRAFANVNGMLYFFGSDATHGVEPWKSDGTRAGTVMIKDINPGAAASVSGDTIWELNGEAYFAALNPITSREIWKTDGTEAGTVLVRDIYADPDIGRGSPAPVVRFANRIYFWQYNGTDTLLYETDGTAAGTVPARLLEGTNLRGLSNPFVHDGYLYFGASDGTTFGLYRTDGTPGHVSLVRGDLAVSEYEPFNGKLYLSARQPSAGGSFDDNELWVTDGTPQGTRLVADIVPGPAGSAPGGLTAGDGVMLFSAFTPMIGRELWRLVPEGGGTGPRDAAVVGRHVFYNNSSFDGQDPGADEDDDGAVATDKSPLLPGAAAGFANVTSYTRGLNGVIIDVRGLPDGAAGELSADDFVIRSGRSTQPADLRAGPSNVTVTLRPGAGAGGSDRIYLTWPDHNPASGSAAAQAVANGWLQVTMKAGDSTGLREPDLFYFANLVGDTGEGNPAGSAAVGALDLAAVKRALNTNSAVTGRLDFNRDGRVNALDLAVVKQNLGHSLPLSSVPIPAAAPPLPSMGGVATAGAGRGSGATRLLVERE